MCCTEQELMQALHSPSAHPVANVPHCSAQQLPVAYIGDRVSWLLQGADVPRLCRQAQTQPHPAVTDGSFSVAAMWLLCLRGHTVGRHAHRPSNSANALPCICRVVFVHSCNR